MEERQQKKDDGPTKVIKAREVLLIDADGNNRGKLPTVSARRLAEKVGLDLVQVGLGESGIPVCRIMDFGKWRFEQSKKKRAQKSSQPVVKEIKLRPNTSDHDLEYRAKRVMEFLGEGNRVKLLVRFRGRERNHMAETGGGMLEKFLAKLDESKYRLERPIADVGERDIAVTLLPEGSK